MKVPEGWNPIYWKKYGRAIPLSVREYVPCDLRRLGPTPSKFDQETLERIRKAGALTKSRSKRSKRQS